MKKTRIGIIGLGSFGTFIAKWCPRDTLVYGFDDRPRTTHPRVIPAAFSDVVDADIVILCVPLQSYDAVLSRLKPFLRSETLLVDVCSVKVAPTKLLHAALSQHKNFLITHPLFGPQSAASSTKDHQLIITESSGKRAEDVVHFLINTLQLKVSTMTAEQHDKSMAMTHALTFFVARSLQEMKLPYDVPMTPSYKVLLDLAALDKNHSQELFETIELGNPFAAEVCGRFAITTTTLQHELLDLIK